MVSAPVIRSAIEGGDGIISGEFTMEEAERIAVKLNAYRETALKALREMQAEAGTR